MGQLLSFVKACPLRDLIRYHCNGVDIQSECGLCDCTYHTEPTEIHDTDSERSFDADTCCGAVHYSEK